MGRNKLSGTAFIWSNKKGIGIDDVIPLLMAVVAFIIIIIVVHVVSQGHVNAIAKTTEEIKINTVLVHDMLLRYLQTQLPADLPARIGSSSRPTADGVMLYLEAHPALLQKTYFDFILELYQADGRVQEKSDVFTVVTEIVFMDKDTYPRMLEVYHYIPGRDEPLWKTALRSYDFSGHPAALVYMMLPDGKMGFIKLSVVIGEEE